ncbi:acid protease, partial [Tothia fuscella]
MQINLDSGTTLLLLPKDIAKSVNDRFVPPAKFNPRLGYTVDCAAKAPKFGVKISGTTFWIDGKDLVLPAEKAGEGCTSAIGESSWPGGLILGAAFMRNVVSVFDVGAAEMRFAARV